MQLDLVDRRLDLRVLAQLGQMLGAVIGDADRPRQSLAAQRLERLPIPSPHDRSSARRVDQETVDVFEAGFADDAAAALEGVGIVFRGDDLVRQRSAQLKTAATTARGW